MKTCPHCAQRLSFFRVLTVTYWTPYKCPHCGLRSEYSKKQMAVVGGVTGGLVGAFSGMAFRELGAWGVLVFILMVCLMVLCVMMFCDFKKPGV